MAIIITLWIGNGAVLKKVPVSGDSHTITPFDAPGKQAFSHSVFYPFG